jgi:hypothetical protein
MSKIGKSHRNGAEIVYLLDEPDVREGAERARVMSQWRGWCRVAWKWRAKERGDISARAARVATV